MATTQKMIKVQITGFVKAASILDMEEFKEQHKKLETIKNAANEQMQFVEVKLKEVNKLVDDDGAAIPSTRTQKGAGGEIE